MGLYDRDYYREVPQGHRNWVPGHSVVGLIALMVSVFIVQAMLKNAHPMQHDEILGHGAFQLGALLDGELWRFFTAPFLYNNAIALIFGMLVLYFFGHRMEEDLGGPEYLSFYLVAMVFTQTVELLIRVSFNDRTSVTFGPSGPITATLVLCALRHPRDTVTFFFIPLPMWLLALLTVLLGLTSFSNRGPSLPLAGAFFAYVYYTMNVRITAYWPAKQAPLKARPRLRIVPRDDDDDGPDTEPVAVLPLQRESKVDEQLEAKVDYVLEKVARQGRDSLSMEENEILMKASEVYRKRRGD